MSRSGKIRAFIAAPVALLLLSWLLEFPGGIVTHGSINPTESPTTITRELTQAMPMGISSSAAVDHIRAMGLTPGSVFPSDDAWIKNARHPIYAELGSYSFNPIQHLLGYSEIVEVMWEFDDLDHLVGVGVKKEIFRARGKL